jgi:dipeptidyl aminopeptidase/acylaminoacyl peptidase
MVVFLLLCVSNATAQGDGTIIESTPCAANTVGTFEQYVEAAKKSYASEIEAAKREGFTMKPSANFAASLLDKKEFERRKAYQGFECQRIKYLSDRLKVVGFIWKPKDTANKKLPLIIFNRGGSQEFGKLTPWFRQGFYYFLEQGFVVVASQYRGNDGGEGKEEFGGADVRDVLNLVPLAQSLGYVDMNNVFMYGQSRGGMMTYLALKNNIAVNAAAVSGGLADIIAERKTRPALVKNVYPELIPDFDKRPEELMRERSAIYFADKINTPLLILQGNADWRVDTGNQALALVQKLQELGKTYELIVYSGDDHGLTLNRADRDKRIVEWFNKHKK